MQKSVIIGLVTRGMYHISDLYDMELKNFDLLTRKSEDIAKKIYGGNDGA